MGTPCAFSIEGYAGEGGFDRILQEKTGKKGDGTTEPGRCVRAG